jgi:hypothetical protein
MHTNWPPHTRQPRVTRDAEAAAIARRHGRAAATATAVGVCSVLLVSCAGAVSTTPTAKASPSLESDFDTLQASLNAEVGVVIRAVGSSPNPIVLGTWTTGPAWSTMKVPLVIAALKDEEQSPATVTGSMRAAITGSDNSAAESIWASLGDPTSAAQKVQNVLREAGDTVTSVQSQRVRPEYTAFGQTNWGLTEQAQFVSAAVCDNQAAPVFALMGQVQGDQRWGLGQLPNTQFKGGWGPSPAGRYLVRQIGVIATSAGMSAVALAVAPASGSLSDGTQELTTVAAWLGEHLGVLPAGQC